MAMAMATAKKASSAAADGPGAAPDRTIRVCNLITRITPAGGAERRLLDAIAAPGTEHSVLAGSVSLGINRDRISAVADIAVVDSLERDLSPIKDLGGVWSIRKAIKAAAPDVLHTHHSKAGMLARGALATMSPADRPRLVHSLSMASFGEGYGPKKSSVFSFLEKYSAAMVDRYLVVGQDLLDSFAQLGISRDKMHCVRSSQELGRWTQHARIRDFDADTPAKLLFVGSLDERKGVHLLADVVRQVHRVHPVTLTVVGEGELAAPLARQTADQDLPIEQLGYRSDVPELMAAADLLVLPSSAEGLPQVLVQAAANQLPAVAFDVHGTHELSSLGADCSVTPLRTATSMADTVIKRIEAGRIDEVAQLPVEQWSVDHIAQQVRSAYDAVLVRSGRGKR